MTAAATVEAGGVELAYDDSGTSEGAAIVLVHGTATARTVWREVVASLEGSPRTIT